MKYAYVYTLEEIKQLYPEANYDEDKLESFIRSGNAGKIREVRVVSTHRVVLMNRWTIPKIFVKEL